MEVGGPHQDIHRNNTMPKKIKLPEDVKTKLKQARDLLRFVLSLDDEEIIRSTIESVADLLDEEISK